MNRMKDSPNEGENKNYKRSFLAITAKPIPYFKELRSRAGSVTAAILWQQLEYWFSLRRGEPFYKYLSPHEPTKKGYKEGDSWTEELGFSESEFRNAFDKIGVRYVSKTQYLKAIRTGDPFQGKMYCSYHEKKIGLTYYVRNHRTVEWAQENLCKSTKLISRDEETPSLEMKKVDLQGLKDQKNGTTESLEINKVNLQRLPNLISRDEESSSPLYTETTTEITTETTAEIYKKNSPDRFEHPTPKGNLSPSFGKVSDETFPPSFDGITKNEPGGEGNKDNIPGKTGEESEKNRESPPSGEKAGVRKADPSEIRTLRDRYDTEQLEVIDQAIDAFASTRSTYTISPAIVVNQMRRWSSFPVGQVIEGLRIYLEKDYAAQGKAEDYALGIIRSMKIRKKAGKGHDAIIGLSSPFNQNGETVKGPFQINVDIPYQEIIDDLNQKSGKIFKVTTDVRELITALWEEGFSLDDFKIVHANMSQKWKNDPEMNQYLRPPTLYNPSKFQGYLNSRVFLSDMGIISKLTEKNLPAIQEWVKQGERKG